ncbi:MAG: hypothetical protein IJA15_03300 [Clostridia bacterium]|nr:hypothetical protein [Clostridia bacterium]
MKKSLFVKLLIATLSIMMALGGLVACGGTQEPTNSGESSAIQNSSSAAHEHSWVEADCLNPKTCSSCGKTQGEALGHNFGEWFETQPATCQAEGEKRRNCSVCGYYETRMIFVIDHVYENGACTMCGKAEEVELTIAQIKTKIDENPSGCEVTFTGVVVGFDSMGYAHVGDETGIIYVRAKHANLTLGALVKISGEGIVYEGSASYPEYTRQIKADGITVELASGNDPTVKEAVIVSSKDLKVSAESDKSKEFHGNLVTVTGTVYVGSDKFNYYLLDDEGNQLVGLHHYSMHFANSVEDSVNKFNALNGKKITLTGVIYRLYTAQNLWTLQYIYNELEYTVISGGGESCSHAWLDADCYNPKTCSLCGATEGEALGHEEVITKAEEPTCEESGLSAGKYCSRCDEVLALPSVVPALGHTEVVDNAVAPTCTETGLTEGKHCLVCKKVLKAQETVAALGHNYYNGSCTVCGAKDDGYHVHSWKAATCDNPKTCSTCGETQGQALGHTWQEATCDTAKTCLICKKTEGGVLGHNFGDTYSYDLAKHYNSCDKCGKQSSAEHNFINGECEVCKMSNLVTAKQFNEYGETFAHNTTSILQYRIKGVITKIEDTTWGNCFIQDESGESVYVYGLYSEDGVVYGSMLVKPLVGDSVTILTVCGNYNGPQAKRACLVELSSHVHSWINATCTTPKTCSSCGATEGDALDHSYGSVTYNLECHEVACTVCGEVLEGVHTFENGECSECGMSDSLTLAQFNEYGRTFALNKYSTLKYRISGRIVHVDESKSVFYIRDEEGEVVSVAGIEYFDGNVTRVELTKEIVVGNTITVVAKCGNNAGLPRGTKANLVTFTRNLVDGYIEFEDYIYFGYYPQTKVTDEELLVTLNQMVGALPTETDSADWIDYGYRRILVNNNPFMWYKDVKVGVDTYRAVYFSTARPLQSYVSSNKGNQGSNGYYAGTVYWFRFDVIRWKVLERKQDRVFLISDLIIDSQCIYRSSAVRSEDVAIWPNNYERSDLRAWLHSDFYNGAFTATQKESILLTNVDNSLASTGDTSNNFVCNNTQDKVFLLSRVEANAYLEAGANFYKIPSAYTLSQGLSINNNHNYSWWLRTPHYYDHQNQGRSSLLIDGVLNAVGSTDSNYTDVGVVPVLWMSL